MDIETLKTELNRCIGCKPRPCEKACPLGVSPHDFIAVAKNEGYQESAKLIAKKNPLPQTCGLVCPDCFCQKACIRGRMDSPIKIPCLQARMIQLGGLPELELPEPNGKKVAVIGGGPAGIGATYELISNGYNVTIYEKADKLGGVARLIPEYRLPKSVLDEEIARITQNDRVTVKLNTEITDFSSLKQEYDDVILALGEPLEYKLNVPGDEACISYKDVLKTERESIATDGINCHAMSDATSEVYKKAYMSECRRSYDGNLAHPHIIIVGGGEVALDCALSLKKQNPNATVEMFVRRRREDMRIMKRDHIELDEHNIIIRDLTSIVEIKEENNLYNIIAIHNEINEEGKARAIKGSEFPLQGYTHIITALGSYFPKDKDTNDCHCAGDMTGNCGTVVQAIASGIKSAKAIMEKE
jgi:NADPH-dependent glutamate synthase beta subunit-like oxidoreductase